MFAYVQELTNMLTDYIKLSTIRSSAILTTSYVAATTLDTAYKYNQLVIYISFTKGSTTSMEWKAEFSPDDSSYYQEAVESYSGGTATNREIEHTIVSANQTALQQLYRFAIPITDRYVKISVKGTGVMTNSLCKVEAALGIN
jgi:hypothetical protein